MNALIIDNEINIIEGFRQLIQLYCPQIKNLKSALSLESGIAIINSWSPDIVFLDVELDTELGTEIINKVEEPSYQLIFITAYNQYALEAFKANAIDYILKPIDPDDLIRATEKAKKAIELKRDSVKLKVIVDQLNTLGAPSKKLLVTDKDSIYRIDLEAIYILEADGPYTTIRKEKDTMLVSKNLKYFEKLLLENGFYRTHHSYLTNMRHMVRFDKSNSLLYLTNGMKVPVSVRKKEGLLQYIRSS